nr:MAG TPA: hypothetical protein [Crassvirales sp.]
MKVSVLMVILELMKIINLLKRMQLQVILVN